MILVYGPTAVFVFVILLVRPLAAAETAEIIRIVVIGESVRLSCLITARHTFPLGVTWFHCPGAIVRPVTLQEMCPVDARVLAIASLRANTALIKPRQVDAGYFRVERRAPASALSMSSLWRSYSGSFLADSAG